MSKHQEFMKKMRYIDEIIGCSCFPDLLALKIFPNGKEITESCAAYNFFRYHKFPDFRFNDPDITLISVGDGCTPRTAAMFAFRTNWNCISIDPNMRWINNGRVKRLTCIREKVEEHNWTLYKRLVILHIHSHALLEVSCNKFVANKRIVFAMPCCIIQKRERIPDFSYIDESIWSPHNKIDVWYD